MAALEDGDEVVRLYGAELFGDFFDEHDGDDEEEEEDGAARMLPS